MTWHHPALAQRTVNALDAEIAVLRTHSARLSADNVRLRRFLEAIAVNGIANKVSSETLGYTAQEALDGAEQPGG